MDYNRVMPVQEFFVLRGDLDDEWLWVRGGGGVGRRRQNNDPYKR